VNLGRQWEAVRKVLEGKASPRASVTGDFFVGTTGRGPHFY
jgi:hypothetical protein